MRRMLMFGILTHHFALCISHKVTTLLQSTLLVTDPANEILLVTNSCDKSVAKLFQNSAGRYSLSHHINASIVDLTIKNISALMKDKS